MIVEKIANRYMELLLLFQMEVKRELDLEEMQFIKQLVAKEYTEGSLVCGKLSTLFSKEI